MADSQPAYRSAADVVRQSRGNVIMRGGDAGDLTAEDWKALLELYRQTCAYCRTPLLFDAPPKHPRKATIDHVLALTQGGRHTKDNVVPSCWRCNSRKGERYVTPLPPPGRAAVADSQPLPPAGPAVHKKFTVVNSAHVDLIVELRHLGRSISDIMRATGLTFNQVAYQLAELQKQGRVPIIGRGRRPKVKG